jgi:S-adenosylmethionine-diacylgycerolhomoserine-N-methlytransferase
MPADMDRIYRHQRHIYDLTRKYYLLGRDRLIEGLAPQDGDSVLEIGCGTGRNLIVAARRYPQAQFFGVDISQQMLDSAAVSIARAGLSSRIRVRRGDATDFAAPSLFGQMRFERVFFSYSLSMIPEWRRALVHATTLLADRGELHIVDFGGQERLPRWFKSALRRWLTLFHVMPRDGLEAALAAAPGMALAIERPYGGYSQSAVLTKRRG